MHTNSRLIFERHALPYFKGLPRVLEIGPDKNPSTYYSMVNERSSAWDTLDIHGADWLTYPNSPLYTFPIEDATYDVVLSGQVIEHVAKIWIWMRELARITKPGGLVITINPCSWPYHEHPIDCWRIYPEGMRALCEDAGLEIKFSKFESLELPHLPKGLPGRSPENQPKKIQMAFRILSFLSQARFPVEKAYDTITIARKPQTLPAP